MRKSILFFFVTLASAVYAQDFEGTIAWHIKADIKDPKMKTQMEQAQKQLNDPATEKKMKEMRAQMEDPQFKAMMESNPQMKAQMEKMTTLAAGGNVYDMIPKSMMVKIKNGNALTKMDGGMLSGEVLYLKDGGMSYHIDRENKTYSVLDKKGEDNRSSKTTVTRTGEVEKILGYSCYQYKVEIPEKGKTITHWIWATPEIKGFDMKGFNAADGRGNRSSYYSEIEGVPLKMEIIMPEMDMTMEAASVKKESLPAGDFVVPSGFREVKGMFGSR